MLVKTSLLESLEKQFLTKTADTYGAHTGSEGKGWSNTNRQTRTVQHRLVSPVVLLLNFFRYRSTKRWLEPESAAKVARSIPRRKELPSGSSLLGAGVLVASKGKVPCCHSRPKNKK